MIGRVAGDIGAGGKLIICAAVIHISADLCRSAGENT
jgi:hypothetical protein